MITVLYTLGNGYHCHCCSRSWLEYTDFNDEASAIEGMKKIAKDSEDFRGIDRVFVHDDSTDENYDLVRRIETAV